MAGLQGEVTVQPLNFPGQFKLGTSFDIQASEASKPLKIDVSRTRSRAVHRWALQCRAQVPFNKDRSRPNTLITLPSRPVTLKVIPAAQK